MSLDCWSKGWTERVGSPAVMELGHHYDPHADWVEQFHLFLLENGQYVAVHESGCSCYDSSEAELEVLPFARATEKYIQYKKEHDGVFTNLELLEFKSKEKELLDELSNRNIDPPTVL